MDLETFAKVGCGDIIRHRQESKSMLVHHADGQCIIAVDVVQVSNVADWRFARSFVIEKLSALIPGLRIRQATGGPLYTVTSAHGAGRFVLATRTVAIQASQADEWVLTHKAVHVPQMSD